MSPKPVDIEIRATGADGTARQLRLVRNEVEALGETGVHVSHSAAIGLSELSRGLSRVAETGQVSMFAMREFTGAAFRLGTALGPAGAIIPVIGVLSFAIFQLFEGTRKQIEETRKKFEEELTKMVNAGDNAQLMKQAMDIVRGTPARAFKDGLDTLNKQEAEILGRLNETAGITHAAIAKQLSTFQAHPIAGDPRSLTEIRTEFEKIKKAILDINNTPLQIKGLEAMKIQAQANRSGGGPTEIPILPQLGELERLFGLSRDDAGHQKGVMGFGLFKPEELRVDMSKIKVKVESIPENLFHDAQLEIIKLWEASNEALSLAMADGITSTFATVIGDAFTGSFDQIGKDALGGLGGILESMGAILIKFGIAMEGLSAALTNPFTSGFAAIGVGILLEGLGKALGAASHAQGGGYSGGAYSSSSAYNTQSSLGGQSGVRGTVVFKGRFLDMNDPETRAQMIANFKQLFGDGDLNFIFEGA